MVGPNRKMPSKSVRHVLVCPKCGKMEVERSRYNTKTEQVTCWITRNRPYRCQECWYRFYAPRRAEKIARQD